MTKSGSGLVVAVLDSTVTSYPDAALELHRRSALAVHSRPGSPDYFAVVQVPADALTFRRGHPQQVAFELPADVHDLVENADAWRIVYAGLATRLRPTGDDVLELLRAARGVLAEPAAHADVPGIVPGLSAHPGMLAR